MLGELIYLKIREREREMIEIFPLFILTVIIQFQTIEQKYFY